MSPAMITLDGVTKRYGADSVAVAALSLTVPDGELCVFVGPSGCGKTTTLRMINRLIEPSGGRILIDGVDVLKMDPVELRRGIGYVIQQGGLFPHRRVADNVATVPRLLGLGEGPGRREGARAARAGRPRPAAVRPALSRTSSPGASASGWAWPGRWAAIHPCCSWTSRSAPSTR